MTARRYAPAALLAAAATSLTLLAGPGAGTASAETTGVTATIAQEAAGSASARAKANVVEVGSKFTVTGKVKTRRGAKRTVGIFEAKGRKYDLLKKTKASKKGTYKFRLAAGSKPQTRTFVIVAARMKGVKGYRSKLVVKVVAKGTTTPPPPPNQPTGVTVTPDRAETAIASAPVTVTGAVSGGAPAGRTVLVEQQLADGAWYELARGTSDAAGNYAVVLPTTFAYAGNVRATVVAIPGHDAGVSAVTTTAVRPNWALGGDPAAFASIGGARRFRWDACAPITYKINAGLAPLPNSRAIIDQVFAHLHQATGYTFVYAGDTTAVPYPAAGVPGNDGSWDLTVAFGTQAHTTGALAGSTIGIGGVEKGWGGHTDGYGAVYKADTGGVILDVDGTYQWTDARLRQVLMHELGHAMGLGHVADPAQTMYPMSMPTSPVNWGAGDFAGLNSQYGRAGGCIKSAYGMNARPAPTAPVTGVWMP